MAKYNVSVRLMQQATDRQQGALASLHVLWCKKVREAIEQGISFTDLAERSSIALHEAVNETGTMGALDFLQRVATKSGYTRFIKLLGTRAPTKFHFGTGISKQTWSFKIGTSLGFNFGHVYDEFYVPYTPVPIGKLSKLLHAEKDYNRVVAVGVGIATDAGITWGRYNEKQFCGGASILYPTTDVAETWNDLTLGGAIFENQPGWAISFGVGRDYDGVPIRSSSWKSLDTFVRSLVGDKTSNDMTLGGGWELTFELALASPVLMSSVDIGLCWNKGDAVPDYNEHYSDEEQEVYDDSYEEAFNPYRIFPSGGVATGDLQVSDSWEAPPGGSVFDQEQEDKMMTKEEMEANELTVKKDRLGRRSAITGTPEDIMQVMDGVKEFMKEAHKFYIPKKFPIVYPKSAPRRESWESTLDSTIGIFECAGGFKKWHVNPFAMSVSWCHKWGFKRD